MANKLLEGLQDLMGKWPTAERNTDKLEHGVGQILAHSWRTSPTRGQPLPRCSDGHFWWAVVVCVRRAQQSRSLVSLRVQVLRIYAYAYSCIRCTQRLRSLSCVRSAQHAPLCPLVTKFCSNSIFGKIFLLMLHKPKFAQNFVATPFWRIFFSYATQAKSPLSNMILWIFAWVYPKISACCSLRNLG